MADILVSYTSGDRDWAFWIGHELDDLGHSPHIHEWELSGGANIMAWMEARTDAAAHVLCVVSEKYLKAPYSSLERQAAEWAAVTRRPNFALPVFVEPCEAPILFAPLKRCDLHGITEDEARARLKAFLEPASKPPRGLFPGGAKSSIAPAATAPRSPFPGGRLAPSNSQITSNKTTTEAADVFDVFLSHSHEDSDIIEILGAKLEDEVHLRVWLDKWILVPGNHWQQEIARGLEQARTCAVCVSRNTPKGWFREEIERALNRQTRERSFRVIPVILPNGDSKYIDDFLELRTWVDFKNGIEDSYAIHVLVSGILGRSPGRYPPQNNTNSADLAAVRARLNRLKILREERLIDDEIAVEFQRRIIIDEIFQK